MDTRSAYRRLTVNLLQEEAILLAQQIIHMLRTNKQDAILSSLTRLAARIMMPEPKHTQLIYFRNVFTSFESNISYMDKNAAHSHILPDKHDKHIPAEKNRTILKSF